MSCARVFASSVLNVVKAARFSTQRCGLVKNVLGSVPSVVSRRNLCVATKLHHSSLGRMQELALKGWSTNSTRWTHSDGDRNLIDFLKDEIKAEAEAQQGNPKMKGFTVTKTDGPNVVLTKKAGSETIAVKFNVNHSVADYSVEEEQGENEEDYKASHLQSRPSFVVEISKGGEKAIAIECSISQGEMENVKEEDQYADEPIKIEQVTILKKGEEWTGEVYAMGSETMDVNLYDMLLNYLDERGIGQQFADELVGFSTDYEHKKYVECLKDLKSFVEAK